METWISYLVVFGIGVEVGVLLITLKPYIFTAKKKRTELVTARRRILAAMQESHEKEILDEAFRTTEAIKGELDRSLQTLRRTLNAAMIPTDAGPAQPKPIIQLSNPVKSGQSAS